MDRSILLGAFHWKAIASSSLASAFEGVGHRLTAEAFDNHTRPYHFLVLNLTGLLFE